MNASLDRGLVQALLRHPPVQPATALWRAVELGALLSAGWCAEGRGLDVGCGDGLVTRLLLERAPQGEFQVVGVDMDPLEAELARASGIYNDVHVTTAASIPEPDSSFDWILANSVLEHIDEIDLVLRECRRVLRHHGELVITVPADGFHRALRGPVVPWSSRRAYIERLDKRLWHLRYWSIDTWREHLDAAGFTPTASSGYMSRAQARRWETASRLTAGVFDALTRGRARPIEVQRRLGLRNHRGELPASAAAIGSRVLCSGIEGGNGPFTCLLIRAVRH